MGLGRLEAVVDDHRALFISLDSCFFQTKSLHGRLTAKRTENLFSISHLFLAFQLIPDTLAGRGSFDAHQFTPTDNLDSALPERGNQRFRNIWICFFDDLPAPLQDGDFYTECVIKRSKLDRYRAAA